MVAVLLVDAVSLPLLEHMLAEGRLPALAELRARGTWHVPAAPGTYFGDRQTVHSGVEVAEHGQTFPHQWSQAEQRLRFYTSFPTSEAVWERVARSGGRPLVIDPYEGRLPRAPSGTVLSGWQFAHSAVLQRWSTPRSEYRRLGRRFGRPPVVEDVYGRPSLAGLERLRRQLLAAPGRVARLAVHELGRQRYDLVWLEFCAGHLAGHHFWDLSLLDVPERLRLELEGTVAESYAAIDAALGQVVAALPPATDVLVLSETGMDSSSTRTDLLPTMLARVLAGGSNGRVAESGAGEALWRLRAAIPGQARMAVTRALPDPLVHAIAERLFLHGVDWRRTRAFVLPSDHDGYIRLNLRGREREGSVDPAEADALVEEIADGLASFADPDGSPCVAGVDRVADLAGSGARSHQLPDLVVRWAPRPALPLRGVTSAAFGDVARRGLGVGRSGNHVDDPWLLVAGGAGRPASPSRPPRLVDVAATAVSRLGADPTGLAGEPLLAG